MPVYIPAEATCDACGKTAPCKLDCAFLTARNRGTIATTQWVQLAIRGLGTWFWNFNGVACSATCKETLANQPRFADYSDP